MAKDNDGYTPLHLAVKANDHKLVQVLLGAQGRAVGMYALRTHVKECTIYMCTTGVHLPLRHCRIFATEFGIGFHIMEAIYS